MVTDYILFTLNSEVALGPLHHQHFGKQHNFKIVSKQKIVRDHTGHTVLKRSTFWVELQHDMTYFLDA